MTTLRRELRQTIIDVLEKSGNVIDGINDNGEDTGWKEIAIPEVVDELADAILEIRAFAKLEKEMELREKLPAGIDAAIAAGRKVEKRDLDPLDVGQYTAIIDELNRRLSINLDKYGENRKLDKVIRGIHKDGGAIATFCNWVVKKGVDVTWYTRVPENIWRDWPQAFESKQADGPRLRTE